MSIQENLPHLDYQKAEPALWVLILTDKNLSENIEHNKFNPDIIHNKPTIQKTWLKAQEITSDPHILTVAIKKQQSDFKKIGKNNIPGKIIFAPELHGTATAVYLGLAHILAKDPNARVVILPVDDYYQKNDLKLTKHINQATAQLLDHPKKALCIKEVISDFTNKRGQIIDIKDKKSERMTDHGLAFIKDHVKAKRSIVKSQIHHSALKSKGIIISKANLLWQCCKELLPVLFEKMEYVYQVMLHFKGNKIGDDYIKMAISHAFYHLPYYDFNKDIINHCPAIFQTLPATTSHLSQSSKIQETLLVY